MAPCLPKINEKAVVASPKYTRALGKGAGFGAPTNCILPRQKQMLAAPGKMTSCQILVSGRAAINMRICAL